MCRLETASRLETIGGDIMHGETVRKAKNHVEELETAAIGREADHGVATRVLEARTHFACSARLGGAFNNENGKKRH
jgi:hypothetical protein